ncbi:Uncharacterised protein [Bordetella pertussis]|nr:Uncharacterised protein [Bordetella pertussis]
MISAASKATARAAMALLRPDSACEIRPSIYLASRYFCSRPISSGP